MGLRPTNRDESPAEYPPRIFNVLQRAFDRAAGF
jgi:hypothetical protein